MNKYANLESKKETKRNNLVREEDSTLRIKKKKVLENDTVEKLKKEDKDDEKIL